MTGSSPRTEKVKATFRAVNELLKHHDMLTETLESGLRELRSELSEILCPHYDEGTGRAQEKA